MFNSFSTVAEVTVNVLQPITICYVISQTLRLIIDLVRLPRHPPTTNDNYRPSLIVALVFRQEMKHI